MTRRRAIPLNHVVKRTTIKKLLLQNVLETVESDAAERMFQIQLVAFMQRYRISSLREKASRERRWRQRKRWEDFSTSLTDRQFRRYFRMPRECFDLLCKKIRANVGELERTSLKVRSIWRLEECMGERTKLGVMRNLIRHRVGDQGRQIRTVKKLVACGGIKSGMK